ncbi:TPA: hypothetical protein ACPSKE_001065 [Legionella feeleii]
MPKVKKVTGTLHDVIKITFKNRYAPPPSRRVDGTVRDPIKEMTKTTPYRITLSQIIKDLNRTHFLPTHGKTVDDFIRDWVNAPCTDYNQGNLSAACCQLLLSVLMANEEIFCKDGPESDRAQRYGAYLQSMRRVDFAYYNDEGILCGVSITYSTLDPSLWIASSTHNTPGKDKDRPTFFLSSEEIVDDDKGESVESSAAAPEFLAFLKSATVKNMFEGVFLADGLVSVEKLEELRELANKVAPINAGKPKTFQTRKALLDKLEKEREDVIALNPALEQASQQSFVRRNAGSLFLGFFAFMTIVSLMLVATGVFAPLGLILESVKDYLVLGGAAAMAGVASARNLASNEHQLSIYQENISEETFETNARAAFIALDKKETEEQTLLEKQAQETAEQTLLEKQMLLPGMGDNHTHEDDSIEFGVIGGLIDEVVADDSKLPKATILVEGVSDTSFAISTQRDFGSVIPKDGIVITSNEDTRTYSQ